ncbi:MAG: carbohydrate ABC transporter permease [Janthinobacterium lividum]
MKTSAWVPFAFLAPALAGLLLFRFAPIVLSLVGGLYSTGLTGETAFSGLGNYQGLADDPAFWRSIQVTLLFNIIINPLQVVLAFLLALLMVRPGRGIGFMRTAVLLPITVSIALTSVLWNLLLDPGVGPVNGLLRSMGLPAQPFFRSEGQALPSLIAICTWRGVGYWMLFMLGGLGAIPQEVNEAAMIDGAGWWRRLIHVTMPLMRRTFGFVLVADTAANFLLFAPVYIITTGGPNGSTSLLMYEAYRAAFSLLDDGRSLAISTVILLIVGTVAALELRLFRAEEGV